MTPNQIIGRNIYHFRTTSGFSQDYLAAYLGVKRELISYYENGKRNIPVAILDNLADLFGVEVGDLLEEDMNINNANLSFAFRSDDLEPDDLKKIAIFKRIVMNYIKMKNLKD